ncbi:complement factor H-related protein 1-like isoform X2 [Epinephelus fuscoguttatus]|uniref:complement factor H-related protein 1-like isoform X2 n=1 Tax=Epinephelus fuscoguttatus TaxID=293821 RepID=UPI0020D0F3D4|nr:complement factor H-related protein 1-like isoform X2 [Epinephelus fuscoguttatus]
MCVRYLGFILLIWFPGALHAQSAAQLCSAPRLDGGFFAPKQQTYSDGTKLSYTCDEGRKPAVKGWWATSTCHNGEWSPEPQCIDEKSCLQPTIPNGKYTENQNGWYNEGHMIRITCNDGYEPKNRDVTAECLDGAWSSVPVCEKSIYACDEPPKIPHAVIVHLEYQEVFAADSEVQYECEDEYTVEGADTKTNIICIAGNWTEGPTCRSSASSHSNDSETELSVTEVSNCGEYPVVPNGDVVETHEMFLRYQCAAFYKQVGPDRVECYNNSEWSEVPTCEAAFCSVDTDKSPELINVGVKYLKDGEKARLECVHQDKWWTTHYSVARCNNGSVTLSRCCSWWHLRQLFLVVEEAGRPIFLATPEDVVLPYKRPQLSACSLSLSPPH